LTAHIDHGLVPRQTLQKASLPGLPTFQAIRRSRNEIDHASINFLRCCPYQTFSQGIII
jgi:hypothetical protein